jgi:hypothetical protein
MMSKCWKTGDSEGDVLAKLKAAQAELLLIIEVMMSMRPISSIFGQSSRDLKKPS